MVAPLRSKSAKEVSSAVLNTWVKGAGGIPKTFHADNGKEFTAHIAQQLYNKLGIHFSFGWAENHQSNPVERFHQTLYKLINSLRAEGEDNFVEGVKTAVMLYNGAKQAQQYQQVAMENQLKAIRRNTAHYLSIDRTRGFSFCI